MMASTPSLSKRSTVTLAVSVEVSPESPALYSTGLPRTPPFWLSTSIAYSTPAIIGAPRNARLPVSGSKPPILRTPSPLRATSVFESGSTADSGAFASWYVVNESSNRLSAPNTKRPYEASRGSPFPFIVFGPEKPSKSTSSPALTAAMQSAQVSGEHFVPSFETATIWSARALPSVPAASAARAINKTASNDSAV